MISRYQTYVPLKAENSTDTDDTTYARTDRKISSILLTALFLSFALNAFLVFQRLHIVEESAANDNSAYAHLASNFAIAWTSNSPYFGEDEALADRLWENISIDNGTVALGDSYVEAIGLPTSQRFPWDQEKGLYLLNGFHSMHCLKTIRQAVLEFDRGLDRSEPTHHILHCLDALRQDILCYADDTPRYTGMQETGRSGTGQRRQCRDWSQLEAWAQQNTACFRYTYPHDSTNYLEKLKFCPEGSPYIAKVKDVFGD
ncbi:hypothetical protein MMC07_001283 [Pseudocyphellaria aurata]|nr:hypothetical protein [Pseudocyphellaria aurata]